MHVSGACMRVLCVSGQNSGVGDQSRSLAQGEPLSLIPELWISG